MFCGFGLFTSFLPSWLESTVGVSSYGIALLFAIGGSANVLASPLAGRLSDHVGRKPLVVWSSIALGLCSAAAPALIVDFSSAAGLFFLAMITVGIRISPLQSLLTALVSDQDRGLLMGLAMSVGQAGFGIGSFIASSTVGAYGYASNALAGAAATVIMAVLVQWGLPEPSLSPSDDPPPTASPESPSVAEAP
jgi:MFS family permease